MKKILFVIAFLGVLSIKGFSQTATEPATNTPSASGTNATPADNPNAGDFSFKEETFDFGNIGKGTPVTHEFIFSNTGKEPIVISNVQASCGCTTPKWPKEPILPGKTSTIQVQYNAAHPGGFNKSVTITSNAKSASKVLYIKGVVQDQTEQTTPDKQPNILSTPNNN